nr:basic helix-loop-helix transcription factor [Loropetalum chinense var. rubrum]
MGVVLGCSNHAVEKDNVKVIQRPENEHYQSKNLILERNRRNRIKDRLFALRALVPKISKMDRAAILGGASEYIEELQKTVKELQDELKELEEEEWNNNDKELKISKLNGVHGGGRHSPTTKHHQGCSSVAETKQMEVLAEVKQIGTRDFLLKFFCEHKQGEFARLVEAMYSLGLQLIDANVTTFNGKVLNIFKVEVSARWKEKD